MSKQTNPAGRVDVLVERAADLTIKLAERQPAYWALSERLNQAGIDLGGFLREQVSYTLKRERITDVKSLRRALRR